MSYEVFGDDDDDSFDLASAAGWLPPDEMSPALMDVVQERIRQVSHEGWTAAHDDAYPMGKLAQAGATYAKNAGVPFVNQPPHGWPFPREWWKPTTPRRDLVKAAALILAEIEKMDRAAIAGGDGTQ